MKRFGYIVLVLLVMLGYTAIGSLVTSAGEVSFRIHPARTVSSPAIDYDTVKVVNTRIGIISYWEPSSGAWDRVPANSTVLINPHNGILKVDNDEVVDNWSAWKQLVDRLRKKQILVLGYVPTGYFDHVGCPKMEEPECQFESRIRLQVKTYYDKIPSMDGIFYDETSPKEGGPSDFKKEYELLRSINPPGRITVFNVGWPSEEAVRATRSGEHLVLYESAPFNYQKNFTGIKSLTKNAQEKGIVVWHLIHTVCREDMCSLFAKLIESGPNYGYLTDVGGDWKAGENTWGSLPRYWDDELAAFSAPNKPCVSKKHHYE